MNAPALQLLGYAASVLIASSLLMQSIADYLRRIGFAAGAGDVSTLRL